MPEAGVLAMHPHHPPQRACRILLYNRLTFILSTALSAAHGNALHGASVNNNDYLTPDFFSSLPCPL